ncbi:enoyl ACP reductase FabMG family protein [Vineibacter terrae]|uniref:enoyl ACP reductase FabMG family protein n=1 Tax=Vineibacter terrae TaxID=2586908 RepID=UPI002E2F05B7|nr:hypothetical protein [Vineibacter terrae]HEX2889776.1 hypothetical protein [Vineibacter terrae]
MHQLKPLRHVDAVSGSGAKDVLVVFGEVFARGYVNGLIEEARKAGMKVIYGTVGRRDENDQLRPLTADELATKDQPLVNVPLECGFDLARSRQGISPCDQLKGLKLSEWNKATLDFAQVEEARAVGRDGFRGRVRQYLAELEKQIPAGANVLIAHTMAGGVPRAKIIAPIMSRVFKGSDVSSKEFWSGDVGRFCEMSFMDVTANSLGDLIELSAGLRDRVAKDGGQVSYVAYGYHGAEIYVSGGYQWQSYSPYLQGFAKLELENIARRATSDGVRVCVFNAPEILTNSSSIFQGVEIALYPLLGAFRKEAPDHAATRKLMAQCTHLLRPEHAVDALVELTDAYFSSDIIQRWTQFDQWPQHSGPEQMELMQATSRRLVDMHKDRRDLLTATLSEVVIKACGYAMLHEALNPREPTWWIGHQFVTAASLR